MIQVLIVDDDLYIRESLKLIINLDAEITVLGTCMNGKEAAEFVQQHPIDIVLMDIRMPECDGVEGTKLIKADRPEVKVLILTTFDDDEYIIEALRNGASGYLLKNIPPDQIIDGIKTIHKGSLLIHPEIAKKLTNFIQPQSARQTQQPPSLQELGLSQTEQAIVAEIANGLSNKEIATQLFLSEGTVKNYISDILSKLELRDRTQLAIYYLKRSL
ncbi:response regulator transcription factor [Paenibacillus albiflavus]|uniref:Response regulator transcription factor n=1 Tax=Paenibacillus albiflavus TaxID=2545760 RepID=A0A4R4EIH6_9BACL|nr:response regulator transcription factor [Paenibacillus albiflavus]TCZ79507.1 response regulator transcription factor [Paenibacillus albiflavus]